MNTSVKNRWDAEVNEAIKKTSTHVCMSNVKYTGLYVLASLSRAF